MRETRERETLEGEKNRDKRERERRAFSRPRNEGSPLESAVKEN